MKILFEVLSVWLFSVILAGADSFELRLWETGAPGSENSRLEETVRTDEIELNGKKAKSRWIQSVSDPTIMVFLPEKGNHSGVAVLICPGGGFNGQEFDKEGTEIALWLNDHGIAGIVLKYRLPDPASGIFVRNGAILDVQRTIRLLRHRSEEWGIDRGRIGVTGFSAGGYLTCAAGTLFDEGDADANDPVDRLSCRPDFIAPIYPLVSLSAVSGRQAAVIEKVVGPDPSEDLVKAYSLDLQVKKDTPPSFIVQAHDDYLSTENSIRFYSALKKAGVSAEMHIYARGGHGFGIRHDRPGIVSTKWPELWLEWMEDSGILSASK